MPSVFKPTVVDPDEFIHYTRKIENLKPGTLLRLTRSSAMPIECATNRGGGGDTLFSRRFDKGECFMITEITNSQVALAIIDGAISEVALVGIEMLSSAESFAYWAFAPGNFTEVKHFFSEFEILCPDTGDEHAPQ